MEGPIDILGVVHGDGPALRHPYRGSRPVRLHANGTRYDETAAAYQKTPGNSRVHHPDPTRPEPRGLLRQPRLGPTELSTWRGQNVENSIRSFIHKFIQ